MRGIRARRLAVLTALVTAVMVVASACAATTPVVVTVTTTPGQTSAVTAPALSSADPAGATGSAAVSAPVSTAGPSTAAIRMTEKPAFGSKDVPPDVPVTITVFSATIKSMTVTGDDGSTVEGKISGDGATWTLGERLKYGTTYSFDGTAAAKDGSTQPITGAMTTVKPAATVRASIQIPNGTTVGVAAPIAITFATPISDKAAAERTFKVTTDKGVVAGSWGWLQDEDVQGKGTKQSIVHWRPNVYWPANTKVHVEADLYGVNYGNGWGREDISSDFTIGRSLVVKADVNSHRLVVVVDDKVVKNYPVSYGKESVPGRNTVSGIHVVTEKFPTFKMCNPKYDYCNVEEHWAVRINNNGEFIHANPLAAKAFGIANISHGCVNMSMADAEDFYNMVIYGDPVEVTGTGVPMTPADSIFDWIYTPEQWKAFSALA